MRTVKLTAVTSAVVVILLMTLLCIDRKPSASRTSECETFTALYESIESGSQLDDVEKMLKIPAGIYDWRECDEVTSLAKVRSANDTSDGNFNYYPGNAYGIFVYFDSLTNVVHGKKLVSVRRRFDPMFELRSRLP